MLGRTSRAVSEATRTRWNAAAATELDPRPSTPRYRQHRWALPLERQYSHRERRGGTGTRSTLELRPQGLLIATTANAWVEVARRVESAPRVAPQLARHGEACPREDAGANARAAMRKRRACRGSRCAAALKGRLAEGNVRIRLLSECKEVPWRIVHRDRDIAIDE